MIVQRLSYIKLNIYFRSSKISEKLKLALPLVLFELHGTTAVYTITKSAAVPFYVSLLETKDVLLADSQYCLAGASAVCPCFARYKDNSIRVLKSRRY